MQFSKPPLTVDGQLDLLLQRGLQVTNRQRARSLLCSTTLFRLTPYMRPFQIVDDPEHGFRANAKLAEIVAIYRFDSELRQLVMTAIERVEVAVRAAISNHMAPQHGAHWYTEERFFNRRYHHARLLQEIEQQLVEERRKFANEKLQIERSNARPDVKQQRIENRMRDNYLRFYAEKYDDPHLPPSWAMLEVVSIGAISRLYQGLSRDRDRKEIAEQFGLPQHVLESWLHTLTFIRNICAHHSRLWNRELSVSPKWPQILEAQFPPPNRRRFFTLSVMLVYLTEHVGPDSDWAQKLIQLLAQHENVPCEPMGLHTDWQERLLAIQRHLEGHA